MPEQGESIETQSNGRNQVALPVVIGIGASAGGLEALQEFFQAVTPETNAAFVVIQHLSPDFKSLMGEILGRHTHLTIKVVEDVTRIEPRHIYLTVPRMDLAIDGDSLRVQAQARTETVHHPINVFFHSMARHLGGNCIAIVLSGTGTDGAFGVRAIKQSGGIVMAQSPETARFDGMPRAAVGTGAVDFTLSATGLAEKALALVDRLPSAIGEEPRAAIDESLPHYEQIMGLINDVAGLQLADYKPGTISRRIVRRMALHQIESSGDYVRMLRGQSEECQALARDCLIHVTRFFRDPKAFEALKQRIGHVIRSMRSRDQPFRVWVVGCSTGEEAYSIAIMLEQVLAALESPITYKIFATDLDAEAVSRASQGQFSRGAIHGLTPDVIGSFFTADGDNLIAGQRIRSKMVFAQHNLLSDPPFPRSDLVVCRNLLIYLRPRAQSAAIERLNFSLVVGGTLFLGPSEVIDGFEQEFQAVDPKWRLFDKTASSLAGKHRQLMGGEPAMTQAIQPQVPAGARPTPARAGLIAGCEAMILHNATCGLLFDKGHNLIYSFGEVREFVELQPGAPSQHINDLIPQPNLGSVLLAMRKSEEEGVVVRVKGVKSRSGEQHFPVDVSFIPPSRDRLGLRLIVVGKPADGEDADSNLALEADEASKVHIATLENELNSTRESLQATIEELESTNEEMQSVNEELLSSNEELQSTNEELHSVNEELYTVNAEHQIKIDQLAEVSEDLESLLQATRIGMLFLDDKLRIRRFTPDVQIALPLQDSDIGRCLTDISCRIDPDLPKIVKQATRTGESWEGQVTGDGAVPLLVAVRPHQSTRSGREDCVVTVVDLTRQELVNEEQRGMLDAARIVERIAGFVLWIREPVTGRFRHLSPSFDRLFGATVAHCLEDPAVWLKSVHDDDRLRVESDLTATPRGRESLEYRVIDGAGNVRWLSDRLCGEFELGSGENVQFGYVEDHTPRVVRERQVQTLANLYRTTLESTGCALILLRDEDKIYWTNAAARSFLLRGGRVPDRLSALCRDRDMLQALRDGMGSLRSRAQQRVTLNFDPALADRAGVAARLTMSLVSAEDGTLLVEWEDSAERDRAQRVLEDENRRLAEQSHTDSLTGLRNRRGLAASMQDELKLCERNGEKVMVLLIDCDNFKSINDDHSHAVGDQVLKGIADRIRESIRPSDVLARIGGDEFVVLLPGSRIAEGAHVAEKLRRRVADDPFPTDAGTIEVTISIGVASASPSSSRLSRLFEDADNRLRLSKQRGRNKVTMHSRLDDADTGADGDRFKRLLQPNGVRTVVQQICSMATGESIGCEVLARSDQESFGPDRFFALARTMGHLQQLDLHCLQACLETADRDERDGRAHVNLFPSTLLADDPELLMELLGRVKNPSKICIELSEQQFVGANVLIRERLKVIRELGFSLALDDVGYGRSALESLLAVDPEVIKIDRSLVDAVDQGDAGRRPFERLFSMVRGLSCEVIAEGVERESQRVELEKIGVAIGQGFLWSRPAAVAN